MDCGWFGLAKHECVEVEHAERVGEHINSGSIYSHCELTIEIEIVDIIDRRRSLCSRRPMMSPCPPSISSRCLTT